MADRNKAVVFRDIENNINELFKLIGSKEKEILREAYSEEYARKLREIKGKLLRLIEEYRSIS